MRALSKRSLACLAILFMGIAAGAADARAQDGIEFFPLDELREGMRGVGLTVFQGSSVEQFDVEILGVLRNASPRQDMVLARLSGGPLAETGILQGMSGSPVYVDGRLVGAVAFAFDSATEPIAGIQPIGQMVSVLESPEAPGEGLGGLPTESVASYVYRAQAALRDPLSTDLYLTPAGTGQPTWAALATGVAGMRPIATPLFMGGVSSPAVAGFSSALGARGFNPVQGGGAVSGTVQGVAGSGVEVVPGASINAEMVRGDINVSANGTVTHVDGDTVYAFGHPFQSTGPSDLPMSMGSVVALVPTRTVSFKLAVPGDVVGRFEQDRSTGIMGRIGNAAEMIPVTVSLETSRNGVERYQYQVINDRFMTPLMMNLTLFELILATERSLGDLTLEISGDVRLRNGETVRVSSAYAGDTSSQAQTATATSAPISYLLSTGMEELAIEGIDLTIRSTDARRLARLDSVRVDRTEVRAGEPVALEVTLRTPDGAEIVEDFEFRVPPGVAPGRLQLVVGDGLAVTGADLRRAPAPPPRDTDQVIRDLNALRRMDRLYVRLLTGEPGVVIGGEELPSLPPSMRALVDSERASNGYISRTQNSPVAEFEIGPANYVIEGQQSLGLTVTR